MAYKLETPAVSKANRLSWFRYSWVSKILGSVPGPIFRVSAVQANTEVSSVMQSGDYHCQQASLFHYHEASSSNFCITAINGKARDAKASSSSLFF